MSDLAAAVRALRDSRTALPNWAKRWHSHRETVESGGAWPIARVHDMSKSDGPTTSAAVAAHIALTASPHVTEALEQLLEAIAMFREPLIGEPITEGDFGDDVRRFLTAARALAAAINRDGSSDT